MEQVIVALVCFGAAVVGMAVHWAKKFVREETTVRFVDYFFRVEKKASITAFLTLIGVVASLFIAGTPSHLYDMTAAQFATFFLAGYTVDSSVNKAGDVQAEG